MAGDKPLTAEREAYLRFVNTLVEDIMGGRSVTTALLAEIDRLRAEIDRLRTEHAAAREAALREAAAWHDAERARLHRVTLRTGSPEADRVGWQSWAHERAAFAILALINTPAGADAGGRDDG